MLIPNHPDDERLSALASRDTDATADATLTAHVTSCVRCTDLVTELGALRVALAELPDLKPSRPLQLLPPVEADHAVDRLGGWARRFFGPVLVSGAALVLVGVIGTASPSFPQMGSAAAPSAERDAAAAAEASEGAEVDNAAASEPAASDADNFAAASDGAAAPGTAEGGESESLAAEASERAYTVGPGDGLTAAGDPRASDAAGSDESARTRLDSARSPWPMVLFAGVALIVAALLMRWILAPRTA